MMSDESESLGLSTNSLSLQSFISPEARKNKCMLKLNLLIINSPSRSKSFVPTFWMFDINNTNGCDEVLPFLTRVKETLKDKGLEEFSDTIITSKKHILARNLVRVHGKEIEKALTKDCILRSPINYLRSYWLRSVFPFHF